MGDKATARETMRKLNVPIIPGSVGLVENSDKGLSIANELGFPVIIKASSGGGGRGMRIVNDPSDFKNSFDTAQSEAKISFNDTNVYIEKYFTSPKHIEIQIISDTHGNVYSLLDRECSVQRRHQKVIEEAPSAILSNDIRSQMSEMSVKIAKEVGYVGAVSYTHLRAHET